MDQDPDLELVESIYDALDRDEPGAALDLAVRAQQQSSQDDPVVHFLTGIALLQLDRTEESVRELQQAVALDPDDTEFRANLALALYRCCRFADARRETDLALALDDDLPDLLHVHALLLEREERCAEAEVAFLAAHELDPDAFTVPHRFTHREFGEQVAGAVDRLPDRFRRPLEQVAITVEELPSDEILAEEGARLDPELLGLFVGTPLTERSNFEMGGDLPARILLFKRNLERCFPEPAMLTEEIARTLYHELGHYLGLDEEELREIDLD